MHIEPSSLTDIIYFSSESHFNLLRGPECPEYFPIYKFYKILNITTFFQ